MVLLVVVAAVVVVASVVVEDRAASVVVVADLVPPPATITTTTATTATTAIPAAMGSQRGTCDPGRRPVGRGRGDGRRTGRVAHLGLLWAGRSRPCDAPPFGAG